MGMIRKTMSIGTLGLVSFRSKAEQLEIAEYVLAEADARTEVEHQARLGAEARADLVSLELKQSRRAAKRRRRTDEAKTLLARSSDAVEEIGHAVAQSAKAAEPTVRRASRRAERSAEKTSKRARKSAKAARTTAEKARHTAGVKAHDFAEAMKDQADTVATTVTETVKERVGS